EGIVIRDIESAPLEELDELQRGRVANITDVGFEAHPQQQHPATAEVSVSVHEQSRELLHDEVRHVRVDLGGPRDETRVEVVLLRLPRQVDWVHRNAVATHPGARLEAHEPEGLGGGGLDDLPNVDAHTVAEHRHLVHERDVDVAEDVL